MAGKRIRMSLDWPPDIQLYRHLAAQSGVLLGDYILLRLQIQESSGFLGRDPHAEQTVEEAVHLWERLEKSVVLLGQIVDNVHGESTLKESLVLDLRSKHSILVNLNRLWDDPHPQECARVLLEAWSGSLWLDPVASILSSYRSLVESADRVSTPQRSKRLTAPTTPSARASASDLNDSSKQAPLWSYLLDDHGTRRRSGSRAHRP